MKKRPGHRGAFRFTMKSGSGGLGLKDLRLRRAVANWNLARLLRLGDLAHEIDMEETVHQRGAGHLDVVGELEATLERAGRDALIEHLALLFGLFLLVAADRQRVLFALE